MKREEWRHSGLFVCCCMIWQMSVFDCVVVFTAKHQKLLQTKIGLFSKKLFLYLLLFVVRFQFVHSSPMAHLVAQHRLLPGKLTISTRTMYSRVPILLSFRCERLEKPQLVNRASQRDWVHFRLVCAILFYLHFYSHSNIFSPILFWQRCSSYVKI